MRKIKKKGFTFIEVMLTTSMIFFIAAAVYGAVSGGINIWKRADNLSRYEDVWIFFEKMKQDIRNGILFSQIPFEGDSTYISFPSIIKRPFRRSLSEGSPRFALDQIVWVKYEFDSRKKFIYKEEKDYPEYSDKKEGAKRVLLSGVSSCKIEYYSYSKINKLTETSLLKKGNVPDVIKVIITIEAEGKKERFSEYMEIPTT